ncbi:MAG TPA: hypothetical protein VD931_22570 [Baekduia sp.]|nr:hypothetical protein [Baekduia sp.]
MTMGINRGFGIVAATAALFAATTSANADSPYKQSQNATASQYDEGDRPGNSENSNAGGSDRSNEVRNENGQNRGRSGTAPNNGQGGGQQGAQQQQAAASSPVSSIDQVVVVGAITATGELREDIERAVESRGAQLTLLPPLNDGRIKRLLASAAAKDLISGGGTGDAHDVGLALGKLLDEPSALTRRLTRLAFGKAITEPVEAAVFTRQKKSSKNVFAFQEGLAEALEVDDKIPGAYVEAAKAKKSYVGVFSKLGVPTVDNVDQASGRRALAAILFDGAEGDFGIKPTAEDGTDLPTVSTKPSASVDLGTDGSNAPVAPIVLLLAAGLAFVGLAVRRARSSA